MIPYVSVNISTSDIDLRYLAEYIELVLVSW